MSTSSNLTALQPQRDQLKSQLSQIGEMRPGSLVARFRKCGKPSCHCAKKGAKGHGPSYSLTHPVGGKTVTRIIPAGAAVEQTRQQLEEYHRFRQLVQQLLTVSEQICDWQLRYGEPESEGVKKKLHSTACSQLKSCGTSRLCWGGRVSPNLIWRRWSRRCAGKPCGWPHVRSSNV